MMKKITLLITFLTVSLGFTQTNLEDFESGITVGVNWVADNGLASTAVTADPATGGTNGLVGQIITSSTGAPWQNAQLFLQGDNIDLTSTNKVVTVDVYSNVAFSMLAKAVDGPGGLPTESATDASHTGNGWETLSFDFNNPKDNTPVAAEIYGRILFFPLWTGSGWNDPATTSVTCYVDNITAIAATPVETCSDGIMNQDETGIDCGGTTCAPCAVPGTPPTVAAPTPPARAPGDVLSIYSDAYTNVTIDDFDFGLCGSNPAVAEEMIAGNPTQHYLGEGCQGISVETNRIDASTFTNLHFDFYTDDAIVGAVFNIKLVDWAGNATEVGATGLELNFNGGTNPQLVSGEWVSVDFDLTSINAPSVIGNLTRSDIAQIHITSNLPNAWYDNLYLYKEFFEPGTCSDGIQNQDETGIDCGGTISGCAPCSGPPTVAAPTPPARDSADVISIYSDAYTNVTIDNFDFGLCDGGLPNLAVSEVMIAGNPTQNYLKPGCQGISIETNRIDASEFTNLHFDFYTDVSGDDLIGKVFNIKLVDWAGNATEVGATGLELNFNGGTNPQLVSGEWVSVDFDLTSINAPSVIGNLTRSDIAQIHITSNLSNAWYDNLYLYKEEILPGTCSDGIQNGDETGIDCGGSCPNVCPPTPTPTVSAPTPTQAVEDILYLYSDAYSNATYQIALTNPGSFALVPPSTYSFPSTDVAILGSSPTDNVRQFDNLNNAFIQFSNTNATDMKYFYLDVWSANATFFRVNLQDTSPAVEGSELFPIVQNQWNRIEIDLDTFGGGGLSVDRDDLFQLIIFGDPVGIADVYIDNVYFSKDQAVLSVNDVEFKELKVYPNPSSNSWSFVSGQETITDISIYNILGKLVRNIQPKSLEATVNISDLSSGIYFAKITSSSDNAKSTVKLIKL
jgi:hypothetical protein